MSDPVEIPYDQLSPEALEAVLEEFVTRDGTQTASASDSIKKVLVLLKSGQLKLMYDPDSESCQLVDVRPRR